MQHATPPAAATRSPGRARRIPRLAAHLGRGLRRMAADMLTGGHGFPRRVADLDCAALSTIIGRAVTSVTVLAASPGTTSHARLRLTGADVPATVFVKLTDDGGAPRLGCADLEAVAALRGSS